MKLAIPSSGADLNAEIDSRFGRCRYFLLVNTKTMEFETVENSFKSASHGAGIKAEEFLARKDVEAVLAANLGPNAESALRTTGIRIVTGVTGQVKEALERYKRGELEVSESDPPERINAKSSPGETTRRGLGPGGECFCPFCSVTQPHEPGMPCREKQCPFCGGRMRRK